MSESLLVLAGQLTRIFVPMIIVIGLMSNSLNIIVLTRPALKRHACSLYFLALAINNLFYCGVVMILNLLADGYDMDVSVLSSALCKIISYALNFCPTASVYFIVFASIDRDFSSSINAQIRQFSNLRTARWTIGILLSAIGTFFICALVAFDISYYGRAQCGIQSDIFFNKIFLILNLTFYVIIAPLAMLLFGSLTIYNTKRIPFAPVIVSRYRRTEGQLSRMLLLQVGTHTILILPFCVVFAMVLSSIPAQFPISFAFAFIISKLPFYLTTTTPFFLYVLSARVYRDELLRLWKKIFRIHRPIHPLNIPNTNRSTFRLEN